MTHTSSESAFVHQHNCCLLHAKMLLLIRKDDCHCFGASWPSAVWNSSHFLLAHSPFVHRNQSVC